MRDTIDAYSRDGVVDWQRAADQYFSWRNPPPKPAFDQTFAVRMAEEAVRARLLDPESARFIWRGPFTEGSWKPFIGKRVNGFYACGYVNARNRFGGYTGDTAFVVVMPSAGAISFLDMDERTQIVDITCSKQGFPETARWTPPPASTPPKSQSVADELAKLADLRDRGVLTNAEFEAQKAKLLGQ